MVAGAQQQPLPQPQQQQQQPQLSAEEEALKRNTDCVYFLASPLTCKKGGECEYRHSEYARVNPRDCWYWLNGNCLNPKCAFRHPPLDGLLGTQATPSVGSAPSSAQATTVCITTAAPIPPATNNSSKQAVPCIFFQKGFCLKGDRCAFSHGSNPTSGIKVSQASAVTHASEPSNVKKAFGSLQKCSQEQKIPQTSISKPGGVAPEANLVSKVETAPLRNEVSVERSVPSGKSFDQEAFRSKAVSAPVMNGMSMTGLNHSHQVDVSNDHGHDNGKDADEFLRESSPGFDVLVDDELRDPDYFHGEDQYGRARCHDGRNLSSVYEYDMDQSAGYGSAADVDRERFRDPHGYDSYDHMQGQYAWEQQRASSERMVGGPAHFERRGYRKSHSPDGIDESDLRHRLTKQRRVNGLKSVISHDYVHDNHVDDRNYRGSSRRDPHQMPQHEGPLSSRLQGRITLPGGPSVNGADLRHDRGLDRGRSRGRLAPSRPQSSTHQGRFRDRLKGKALEDFNNEGRSFTGSRSGREALDDGTDFAAPKSLSELKVGKVAENKGQSYLGKRKSMRMEVSQSFEGDLSFEGPKPLSEILKRKRKAEAAGAGNVKFIGEMQHGSSSLAKEGGDNSVFSNKEEFKSATTDVVGTEDEKIEASNAQADDNEVEDGMIYDENVDDQELEAEDQTHGDYDYEQDEEEGEYDGENVEGEGEYLEDEEGDDDFAKRIGVMFS